MALYLKYRPQNFSDLVGQDFIKETLKKAVAENKTVGAYMFTGPRGTGKTSSARIFAKAINCENIQSGDPCGTCEVCKAFQENSLIDIIEIDAASHTGVDNIRDIIDKAQFQPTRTKYKVYIIDEVHMLSKGAFNALLKILEEPPVHVKFILATTDIHKVPDTILSRCQRYDFRNFSDTEIRGRLEFIAQAEGIKVDNESYDYIIKSSGGGMRNAVSLFEQLIVDGAIEFARVFESQGLSSSGEREAFISKLLARDVSVLDDFASMMASGKNLKNFLMQVESELYNSALELLKSGKDISAYMDLLLALGDCLTKSKNSFNEAFSYKVGLMKIVSHYVPASSFAAPVSPQASSPKTSETSTQTSSHHKESELSHSAVEDIFASDSPVSVSAPQTGVSESIEANFPDISQDPAFASSAIDINALNAKVKELGGKAALTMSIKGSQLSLQSGELVVIPKTKISRSTIEKVENKDILASALSALAIEFSSIVVR